MKRAELLQIVADLFVFQTATDSEQNEYILLRGSCDSDLLHHIPDKTEFECSCNHIHLLDHVRKQERASLELIARQFADALLKILKYDYPQKHFRVFATISDSFAIRFHQDWPGEPPFCNTEDFVNSHEFVYMAEG